MICPENFIYFILMLVFGPQCAMLRDYYRLCVQGSLMACSRDHMGCMESILGHL